MVEKSYPFYTGGPTNDVEFSRMFREMTGSGVIRRGTNPLKVFTDSTAPINSKLPPGSAFVQGHYYENFDTQTLVHDAPSGNPRIDTVVLELSYGESPQIIPRILKGTPGTKPEPSALVQTDNGTFQEGLSRVAIPASGATLAPAATTDIRRLVGRQTTPTFDYGAARGGVASDPTKPPIIKAASVVVLCNEFSAGSFSWPGGPFPGNLISIQLTPGDNTVGTTQLIVAQGTDLDKCVFVARLPGGGGIGKNLVRVEVLAIGQ